MIMYNRIGAPELLLWLIEALHISLKLDTTEFKEFVTGLSKLGRSPKKQCKMIRDKYPYRRYKTMKCHCIPVEELLVKHRGK